jgi:Mn2+/Fe2+ NRAMP family transporter
MLVTFPLMAAIQEISARIGRTTGHGIAGNLRVHYPATLLHAVTALLFAANTINIAADLGAMADAVHVLFGGPGIFYVILFGVGSIAAEIFLRYERYVSILKWATLSLFAYVAVLVVVQVPWREALVGALVPQITWSATYFTTLVAIFGTTISPYLFFWQASQEVEDMRVDPSKKPLLDAPQQAASELRRIRADTAIGMAFSNLIALSIIIATAATLHRAGITDIETSAQAAQALRPIAGDLAELIFAAGIVATGLLAIPVLAGASAYAIGESRRWHTGLSYKPREAIAFNTVLAVSALAAIALNLSPINPISALYWSAVINGVLAVPVMVLLMLIAANPAIMGRYAVRGWLLALGWIATAVMTACVAAMGLFALS